MKKGNVAEKSSESEGKAWGHGKFANMPTEVVMKDYPAMGGFKEEKIDDSMSRLESDAKDAKRGERKSYSRGMY